MFARLLLIPFVLLALLFLYLTWEVDSSWSLWIIPPVIIAALTYIFSPQLNWWWYQKNPPKLDPMVATLIGKHIPLYHSLLPHEQKRFRHRVALFDMAKEWVPQGMESVPTDVKGMVAASAVWLTFGREDYLLPKFETIVVYPHPFPSPQYDSLHASEIHIEDGVIVFSLEHFVPGFAQTARFYHLGLHEFAKVFLHSYSNEPYPRFADDFWEKLPQISGLTKVKLEGWIGLPQTDPLPVAIVHFFTHSANFRAVFPHEFEQLRLIFNLDPTPKTSAFSAN